MESREYRGRSSQHSTIGNDPFWLLVCLVVILFVCLIALPWVLVGILAERCLARWLHWRLSFLSWFILWRPQGLRLAGDLPRCQGQYETGR